MLEKVRSFPFESLNEISSLVVVTIYCAPNIPKRQFCCRPNLQLPQLNTPDAASYKMYGL